MSQEEVEQDIAKKILVERMDKGETSIPDLGRIVAANYSENQNHSRILEALVCKVEDLQTLKPHVESLREDQYKGRWIVRTSMAILASCGVGLFGVAVSGGKQIAYLSSLSDGTIGEIADKRDTTLRQELTKQTAELSHKMDVTTLELKNEFTSGLQTHQAWEQKNTRKP